MNKYFFALGLGPALALGACGGGDNTTVTTENVTVAEPVANDMGTNMMATPAAMTGQQFADTAAASDMYEIEAGKLAQQKATMAGLKDFGKMMVEQHGDSTAKLKAAGMKASPAITPNPKMTDEQTANLATLRDATGADFDAAYKAQQVAAHEKALMAMQDYAANGDVAELKAFAADTSKVVQTHLDKIKAM